MSDNKTSTNHMQNLETHFQAVAVNTLKVPTSKSNPTIIAVYNQKHNMFISCCSDNTIHFHNATTLKNMTDRKKKELKGYVANLSYWSGTDTYLIACKL